MGGTNLGRRVAIEAGIELPPEPRPPKPKSPDPLSLNLPPAAEELLDPVPVPEVLGTMPLPPPTPVQSEEPPPPWETDPVYLRHNGDARRFVRVPDNVELRWLSPRLVSVSGLRDWQAVPAKGDSRFKLLNKSMAAPDNTIRRGGHDGMFLAWMYRSWVESRKKLKAAQVARHTQSAVARQDALRQQFRRGSFSGITVDSAQHPTHTIAEGATMAD
jgi:hypothetical protein